MKRTLLMTFVIAIVLLLSITVVLAEDDNGSQDGIQGQTGWNENRTVYYDENGNPTTGLFKAHMKNHTINALYYANEKGKVRTRPGIVTINGDQKRYLYKSVNGDSGFDEVPATDKTAYTYFISNEDGDSRIVSKSGLYSTEKATYFVLSNGTVQRNEGFVDCGGKRYYVQKNGCVKTKPGWIRYKGKKYRIGKNGIVRTKEGAFTIDGKRYVIKVKNGPVCTKRAAVRANGKLYFVTNSKGVLGSNLMYRVGEKKYHVNKYGVIKVGRHKWKDNKYYYSISKGYLKPSAGMITKDGKRFFVKKGGLIVVNQRFKHNNYYYIAGKTGTIKTGLFKWRGALYYASAKGALKRNSGIVQLGDYSYYVAAGGRVYVNQKFKTKGNTYIADSEGHLQSGMFKWNGYTYIADSNYRVYVNQKFQRNGYTYIADSEGRLQSGFFKWGGYDFFADSDYHVFIDKKFRTNGSIYIADSNGHLQSGIFKWNGYTYGADAYNRVYIDKKFSINEETYIADSNGHLQSGFFKYRDYYYYADPDCSIYIHQKFRVNGNIYMTGTTGHLKSGVFMWYGDYYYADSKYVLDTDEEMITYDGNYYFNKDEGGLARKEWIKYKGKYYYAGNKANILTSMFQYNGYDVWPKSDGAVDEEQYLKVTGQAVVIEDDDQDEAA